jgi:hypothetical protein
MRARTVAGWTVLGIWVGALGWQARREYFQPELSRLAEATATLAPGTNFYALRMGGQVIGISSSLLDTVPEGFVLEEVMNLELQALGQPGTAVARTRVVLTPTLRMTDFAFSLTTDAGVMSAEGRVDGDSLIRVDVGTGGTVESLTFRVQEPPLFTAALPIRLAKGGELVVGRTLRLAVFDPSSVSLRTVEIEVMEEDVVMVPDSAVFDAAAGRWAAASESPVRAWRLRESFGGVTLDSWIDEDGRVVRSTSAMGLSVERTAYELALQEQEDARSGLAAGGGVGTDVVLATAIASNRIIPDPFGEEELRFLLAGVDLTGFELDGGRQELRGDTLVVRREDWSRLDPGYTLPYPSMDMREALEAEPLIQSGDPRILDAARTIAQIGMRGRANPRTVAERLTQGVFLLLDKTVSFSLPSATQVLESRRGDCNEHTVLYVAMARSVGLPARVAVGLVYLEGAFYYHAWPEVWLGEWVAVDPTFGQTPAGAAHLRFVTGSPAQQLEIARLIGALRIEVLGAPS